MLEWTRIVPGNDLYFLEVRVSGHWLLVDCAEKPQRLENKLAFLNEAFRQAVAEERERCATVASELLPEKYEFGSYQYGAFRAACHEIADAIRQGGGAMSERARMVPGDDPYYAVRRALQEAIRRVEDESQRDASKRLKKWQAKRRLTLDEWFRVIGNAEETRD